MVFILIKILLLNLDAENGCMTLAASGSDTGAIYVYNKTTLKWAAKLPFVPVHISRILLGVIKNKICIFYFHFILK